MNDHYEKAKVSIDRGETDKAAGELLQALDADFGHAEAAFMLGGIYLEKEHPGIASILTKFAIDAKRAHGKQFPEGWRNLGAAFKAVNAKDKAEVMWKTGLEVAESLPEPIRTRELAVLCACLATSHISEGSPAEALQWSDRALSLAPGTKAFLYNRSLAELELGDWANGWKHYECGFATEDRRARRYGELPEWDGTSDKTVIVWGEQGIGDEILFASCLPDMIKICQHVIVDCHPRLIKLFERSFPQATFHPTRKIQSGVDWLESSGAEESICAASLMTMFRQSKEDYPGTAYLKAGSYPGNQSGPRIGISWYGGTLKTRSDLRSITLDQWKPILQAIPHADIYSLQYGDEAARHVCALYEDTGIHVKHFAAEVNCQDYDRTASFVQSMDLVVTVTTALYHLAGALGVPCWTLIPSKPTWQYGTVQGGQSVFYNSCKLFRQQPDEPTWAPTVLRVAQELRRRFA